MFHTMHERERGRWDFSDATRAIWAKKSRDGLWLPLIDHLQDTAKVARMLWDEWVSSGARSLVAQKIGRTPKEAGDVFVFLAAIHDLGKATPAFVTKSCNNAEVDGLIDQRMCEAGIVITDKQKNTIRSSSLPHAKASEVILKSKGCPPSIATIIGAHHGKPSEDTEIGHIVERPNHYHCEKDGKEVWNAIWDELIQHALGCVGLEDMKQLPAVKFPEQMWYSGLLVMADWYASDEGYFPYIPINTGYSDRRTDDGIKQLDFSTAWTPSDRWKTEPIYEKRFAFTPNAVQEAVLHMVRNAQQLGICVVEAPMGIGKTEMALVLAEAMAQVSGRRGIYFALPSQATSDGVFKRVKNWLEKQEDRQSLRLMHAKAHLNKEFQQLAKGNNIAVDEEDGSRVYVHSWFSGNKRALLDDFVVGTIDQLLMMALKQKHVMLRHLGLTNKIVIIDECHAYDAYMGTYLKRVLHWLGAYKVPVVVLSATLPVKIRQDVIDAYRHVQPKQEPIIVGWGNPPTPKARAHEDASWKTNRAYPLCTMTDGNKVVQAQLPSTEKKKTIAIERIEDENIANILDTLLSGGGCVGIIVNTVKRAQHVANDMRMRFGEEVVTLFHSRFIACDRVEQEQKLLSELGKNTAHRPPLRIVVGTQVLEQSLDIDFDVLITDVCPMDLMLQRMGRLHRHERARPDPLQHPRCFVTGASQDEFDRGTKMIYGEYLLMRTKDRMPTHIVVPDDIAPLVQDVYDESVVMNDPRLEEAKKKYDEHRVDKETKAEAFRLSGTNTEFDSCLDVTLSDHVGQAAVRDTREGFEVILVQKKDDGYYFLPWVQDDARIFDGTSGCDWGKELAKCSVRLPEAVCGYDRNQLDQTEQCIHEQMKPIAQWIENCPWLRHELILTLDDQFVTFIRDYLICYNQKDGLTYTKREGGECLYGAE